MQHRGKDALVQLGKRFPDLSKVIDSVAFGKAAQEHVWPRECFLPESVWEAVALVVNNVSVREYRARADFYSSLTKQISFLGTWSKTQGIYRFDPDVYAALMDAPFDGDIPCSVLRALPEWCVYIETPGLTLVGNSACEGCWVRFVGDVGDEKQLSLGILFDVPLLASLGNPVVASFSVPMESVSLASVVERYRSATVGMIGSEPSLNVLAGGHEGVGSLMGDLHGAVAKVLSLLLYICTQNDYSGGRDGSAPANPQPKKTKNGLRMLSPSAPAYWDVGVRMGSELRRIDAASAIVAEEERGTVRPHIRRHHWHGFRTGPMKTPEGQPILPADRGLIVKFLPVTSVNMKDGDEGKLPAVVRVVK